MSYRARGILALLIVLIIIGAVIWGAYKILVADPKDRGTARRPGNTSQPAPADRGNDNRPGDSNGEAPSGSRGQSAPAQNQSPGNNQPSKSGSAANDLSASGPKETLALFSGVVIISTGFGYYVQLRKLKAD